MIQDSLFDVLRFHWVAGLHPPSSCRSHDKHNVCLSVPDMHKTCAFFARVFSPNARPGGMCVKLSLNSERKTAIGTTLPPGGLAHRRQSSEKGWAQRTENGDARGDDDTASTRTVPFAKISLFLGPTLFLNFFTRGASGFDFAHRLRPAGVVRPRFSPALA